jgi:hypothetical protein
MRKCSQSRLVQLRFHKLIHYLSKYMNFICNSNVLWWSYYRLKILSTSDLSDTTPIFLTVSVLYICLSSTSVPYFKCRIWSSHSVCYELFCLLGYNFVYYVESQPTFRRNNSPPYLLSVCFVLVSCMAYSLNLKAKVTSSETSVHFLHGVISQR